jgi:hypothetical protein
MDYISLHSRATIKESNLGRFNEHQFVVFPREFMKTSKLLTTAYLLISCFISPSLAAAPRQSCSELEREEAKDIARIGLRAFSKEFPDIGKRNTQAWKDYLKLAEDPDIAKNYPYKLVAEVLTDIEMWYFGENLVKAIDAGAKNAAGKPITRMRAALRKEFETEDNVNASSIDERLAITRPKNIDEFRRMLGDMTLEEVQELTYGSNPLKPSKDSLLGRYIAETGARTLVRSFNKSPKTSTQGPKRLVVSISQESLPVFKQYFDRLEYMSVINHAQIVHSGALYDYGAGRTQDFMLPGTEFKILPIVVLKTTEAMRLDQFLSADEKYRTTNNRSWTNEAQQPWQLGNYCARSAYGNCTQKIGNMPIGDKLVDEYVFPGATDNYADNRLPNEKGAPRRQKLQPYEHPDPLIKRVWKVPGNQQFAELIGEQKANLKSEFANPGWVIQHLTGTTTVERVPVVFVIRDDHRQAIPRDFTPQFENPL